MTRTGHSGMRRDAHLLSITVLLAAGMPGSAVALALLWTQDHSAILQWTLTVAVLAAWLGVALALRSSLHSTLRTMASLLAALRAGDYSIRARHAGGDDPLSLVYVEINGLERQLREQRLGAVEASDVLHRVLAEVDTAVMAFDERSALRVVNRAGERLLGGDAAHLMGRSADELRLGETLAGDALRTLVREDASGRRHWQVRRNVIRQGGERLTLVVMTDLERTLREEERAAWYRLVRVLGHEINNSLAPIKSIAESVRALLRAHAGRGDWAGDADHGLGVVASRAESLRRFLAAYARLARLPPPTLARVDVATWVQHVAELETRMAVIVRGGDAVEVCADRDQLDQALINLIANAADACVETAGKVEVHWRLEGGRVAVVVDDEGAGIVESDSLFVPFYTTKPGGSGIGLVLSQHIAENHGGSLILHNRTDRQGVRARLTLPQRHV